MKTSRASWVVRRLVALLAGVVSALVVIEIVLRLFPALISEAALSRFPDSLRTTVAKRLQLPTEEESIVIASADRFDGGPPIDLLPPNRFVRKPTDRVDREAGASSGITTDRNGFCNSPTKAERATADIVVVGDSFTFCTAVTVEQAATAQIEEMTGRATYNLGVEGVGPHEYVEILRRYAAPEAAHCCCEYLRGQ